MSQHKLIKTVVFSIAVFTAVLNLAIFSYSINYYLVYNGDNVKMISDFRLLHQEKNSESEFNELCSKIKPINFTKIYNNLTYWSEIVLEIYVATIFSYFVYLFFNKKERNFKFIKILLLILFLSFLMYFFSLDTDYDILYCLWPYVQSR